MDVVAACRRRERVQFTFVMLKPLHHAAPWPHGPNLLTPRLLPAVPQVRPSGLGRPGGPRVNSDILLDAQHTDLISYGLIPEFVGRLPVLMALQVRASTCISMGVHVY